MEPRVTGSALSSPATQIFPAPLEKSPVQAPLGTGPTPRVWMASSVSFKSSGYTPERRVPITIIVKDRRGQSKRETVAYAVGPNRKVAVARANQILAAVNALIAPVLLLIPSMLIGGGL